MADGLEDRTILSKGIASGNRIKKENNFSDIYKNKQMVILERTKMF
jgi:hypothetical protein